LTDSTGVPITYETETYVTPSGAQYTYEDITYPSGTVEFTTETFTTSDMGTGSWVTEVLPNGQSLSYTVFPPSDSLYVPSPVTYSAPGEEIIYSYVPTSSGTETITYVEKQTPSGSWATHVSAPTAHGGVASYTETVVSSRSPSGAVVEYITETNSSGETTQYTESTE
jgi:hypothetical protein